MSLRSLLTKILRSLGFDLFTLSRTSLCYPVKLGKTATQNLFV